MLYSFRLLNYLGTYKKKSDYYMISSIKISRKIHKYGNVFPNCMQTRHEVY